MTFKKLAKYFQKLESTSSRNTMVEILAQLFSEASFEEIDKVVYLTQGRVAPLYEPVEFQMAEKMVIRAMALAFNTSIEEVTKNYKKTGDLGKTAEVLSSSWSEAIGSSNKNDSISRSAPSRMTVEKVFEQLTEITKINGEGSVEKKIAYLAQILKDADPVSARYIARIPIDKMRLGFSDMTVLEGLSWMVCGAKKQKDKFETAYNIRPDLGYIAKKVKENNLAVEPAFGTPILVMRAERLTTADEILGKTGEKCAVEPKLDGLRTQLHFTKLPLIKLFSRGLEDVTTMYPDLVKAAGEELNCDDVILDGEAIGFDPKTGKYLPFQETVQRKRKYEIEAFSQNVPLRLVVFDCLYFNGKSLISEPYTRRRDIIEKLIKNSKLIVCTEMKVITESADLDQYFEECVNKGLEGIVAKKLDGEYQAGARGWNWIKYKKSYSDKLSDTVDAVVMGIDFGQGKRNAFGVGAFLIGIYDPKSQTYKTISKVGTGLTDEEWKALAVSGKQLGVGKKPTEYEVNKLMDCDLWFRPEMVGEFKADELTKSPMHTAGYALRFPRLVRWREKKPQDTTSLQEIAKLANLV